MTTSQQPQDTSAQSGQVQPQEGDKPNEFGFAGDGTAPQPDPGQGNGEGFGESIAVPAGDLTGAVAGAIDEATTRDADDDKS